MSIRSRVAARLLRQRVQLGSMRAAVSEMRAAVERLTRQLDAANGHHGDLCDELEEAQNRAQSAEARASEAEREARRARSELAAVTSRALRALQAERDNSARGPLPCIYCGSTERYHTSCIESGELDEHEEG